MGVRFTGSLLALALCVTAGAAPAGASDEAERLAFGFMQTVFGTEYDKGWWFSGANRVKKYTEPVRFYVHNKARKDRRGEAEAFLANLPRAIPGFDGALAYSPREANFHLYVVDKKDFAATVQREAGLPAVAAHNAECLVHIWFGRRGISESRAVIVSDGGENLFRRCLVEEVLQGLGPINDSPALTESVFNDYSKHDRLTAFDRMLLQMLYHPAIKPGMGRRDVEPLLARVIADIRGVR